MNANEKLADELGQIIFRIETNLSTWHRTSNPDRALECLYDIGNDIEHLKDLKTKISNS